MLRVSLDILDTEGVMEAVSKEKADVGFIYADRMHHNSLSYLLHKKSLEMYPVKNAGLTFTVGKNNKFFAKENVKTLNLSRQRLITLKDDLLNEKNYHHDRMLKSLGIERELHDALQTNSADFLGYMLQETDYGYLHYSCSFESIDEKRQLRHFHISHEDHGVTWCYIKKKYGALKSEVEEFIKEQGGVHSNL